MIREGRNHQFCDHKIRSLIGDFYIFIEIEDICRVGDKKDFNLVLYIVGKYVLAVYNFLKFSLYEFAYKYTLLRTPWFTYTLIYNKSSKTYC